MVVIPRDSRTFELRNEDVKINQARKFNYLSNLVADERCVAQKGHKNRDRSFPEIPQD